MKIILYQVYKKSRPAQQLQQSAANNEKQTNSRCCL